MFKVLQGALVDLQAASGVVVEGAGTVNHIGIYAVGADFPRKGREGVDVDFESAVIGNSLRGEFAPSAERKLHLVPCFHREEIDRRAHAVADINPHVVTVGAVVADIEILAIIGVDEGFDSLRLPTSHRRESHRPH